METYTHRVNINTTSVDASNGLGLVGNYFLQISLDVFQSTLKLFKMMSAFSFHPTAISQPCQRRVFKTISALCVTEKLKNTSGLL